MNIIEKYKAFLDTEEPWMSHNEVIIAFRDTFNNPENYKKTVEILNKKFKSDYGSISSIDCYVCLTIDRYNAYTNVVCNHYYFEDIKKANLNVPNIHNGYRIFACNSVYELFYQDEELE